MEIFGIILSIPAAFIASIFYAFVLRKVTTKMPFLILPLLWISVIVLIIGLFEFCCIAAIGTLRLREAIGALYYSIHTGLFFLTLPALTNIMRLQKRFSFLSKWYSIGGLCAVVGLCLALQQYVVSEALFGVDVMGG
jgi:hypothetical protein